MMVEVEPEVDVGEIAARVLDVAAQRLARRLTSKW